MNEESNDTRCRVLTEIDRQPVCHAVVDTIACLLRSCSTVLQVLLYCTVHDGSGQDQLENKIPRFARTRFKVV